MEQQWEEAEQILSWREMRPGVYKYHGIEHRGINDYGFCVKDHKFEKNNFFLSIEIKN